MLVFGFLNLSKGKCTTATFLSVAFVCDRVLRVAQAGFKFDAPPALASECWDHRCVPPRPAVSGLKEKTNPFDCVMGKRGGSADRVSVGRLSSEIIDVTAAPPLPRELLIQSFCI